MSIYEKPIVSWLFLLQYPHMTSRKQVWGFLIGCVAVGIVLGGFFAWKSGAFIGVLPADISSPIVTGNTSEPIPKTAHLLFVGDLMVDRGVENSVKNNMGGDFGNLFANIGTFLKNADGVFLNLEGPVTAKGPNVGSRFSFAMDEKILPALVANNVRMVSFANNHVGDRSVTGFTNTLTNLEKNNLSFTGAGKNITEASTVKIQEINGIKIGFIGCSDVGPDWLAATETSAGQLLCSNKNLAKIITDAKTQVDFLVFSAHWGVEYHPRTTRQQIIAHAVIDAGADMVIGHHPHVIQATEWYKDKFIAYSLGNFIFDQYFSDPTMQGLMVDAIITPNEKTVVKLHVIELAKDGNKYQPASIRDATGADFITRGVVAAQTCPSAKNAETNLWLSPVGPDLDIGNYIPKDLIPLDNRINVKTTASCLTETAANALITMVDDMEDAGLKIIMTSGFRTRGTQETIHNSSTTTAEAATDPTKYPSVALPGHSEHQLGVAVDMKSASDPAFSYDNFKHSAEYAWLVKNAATYGFIQSYREGTESITGYIAEPWHWRYVGKDRAKDIMEQGITVYEYLKNLN